MQRYGMGLVAGGVGGGEMEGGCREEAGGYEAAVRNCIPCMLLSVQWRRVFGERGHWERRTTTYAP